MQEYVCIHFNSKCGSGRAVCGQPLHHHHGLDGEVAVAVDEVALDDVVMLLVLLPKLLLYTLESRPRPHSHEEERLQQLAPHLQALPPGPADDVPGSDVRG